jgi:eukaryotic-like serine/threonine-protein kinase
VPLSPGDLLAAKYRIEAEIGRGAFGRDYRARDIALDVSCAFRLLTDAALSPPQGSN